jgi:hypothetical protein
LLAVQAMPASPRLGLAGGVVPCAPMFISCRGGLPWCRVWCGGVGAGWVPRHGCCLVRERQVFVLLSERVCGRSGRGIARGSRYAVCGCLLGLSCLHCCPVCVCCVCMSSQWPNTDLSSLLFKYLHLLFS